jgi:predicted phosphodiesterase
MITDPELIAFAGDWHGNADWAVRAIHACAENGVQAIIQAGDHGFNFSSTFISRIRHALDETGIDLGFVKGNHDNASLLAKWPLDEQGFGHPRFGGVGVERYHYIPQAHRWQWWGKTFMGLGGAVSVDRQWRREGITWWPDEEITYGEVLRAMRGGKVDVMVTHDIPAKAKLPNDRKSRGWPQDVLEASERHRQMLQEVVDEVQPELLVHGHFHQRFEQMVGGLRIVGLDMDETSFEDNLFIVGPDLIERNYRKADYPDESVPGQLDDSIRRTHHLTGQRGDGDSGDK